MNEAAAQTCSREPLRIAIIAHPLHAGGGISVGRNMIATLKHVAPQNDYFISFPSGLGYEEVVASVPKQNGLSFSGRSDLWRRWRFEQRELKPALRSFQPDLILALASKGVEGFDCPQGILCHNPYMWYPRRYYGHYSPLQMALVCLKIQIQRFYLRRDLRRTQNFLLHQTFAAKERIQGMLDLRARPIHCPNAVSKFAAGSRATLSMPEAMKPYAERFKVFYLTRYYPHKNLEAIIDVFRRYGKDLADAVAFITIAEDQHGNARRLLETIERHGLQNQVINVGPLPQEDLGAWFANCDALLMPTLLESFSGTYLEAMHFSLPIMTSDLDFAREVCGDAAIYFDPWDVSSIRDAILEIRDHPEKAQQLCAKGEERLRGMNRNWEQIVAHVLSEVQLSIEKSRSERVPNE